MKTVVILLLFKFTKKGGDGMKCTDFEKYLDNYENLNNSEKNNMLDHAAMCEKCQAELDFFLSMISTAKSLPKIEPPMGFADALNARLDKEDKRVVSLSGPAYHLRRNRKQYAALAACLALITLLTANHSSLLKQFETDDSGVIIEETVEQDTADPITEDAGTAAEVTETSQVSDAAGQDNTVRNVQTAHSPASRPASSKPRARASEAPVYTETPVIQSQSTAASEPAAYSSDETVAVQAEEAPVQANNMGRSAGRSRTAVSEDYGIALAGVLNSGNETAAVQYDLKPDEVSASLQRKSDYSIVEDESIAYGRYYKLDKYSNPISNATAIGTLKISASDADLAMDILNRYSIDTNGGVYTTDSVNLSLILSKLRNNDISFTDYTVSDHGEVKFKIQFN